MDKMVQKKNAESCLAWRLQPPSQTFCVTQTQELPKSCSSRNSHILESNPPSALGEISVTAPVQSARRLLALPPAPSQGQIESKNVDDLKTKLSKPLDAYQIPIESQDPPLLPLGIPDIPQPLACTDPLSQEEQPGSENADLGENSLSRQDLGTLENGIEPSSGLADITTLAEDIHLPQLFNSLKDLDRSQGPNVIKAKDTSAIKVNQVQEKPSAVKVPSDRPRKDKQKASEPISGAPKAKIQPKNPECLLGGEALICNAAVSDRAPANTAKHSQGKPQKAASGKVSQTKSHGQEKTKRTRGRNKAEENKQSGNKVKAEDKPAIPNTKRKEHQTELLQESFQKPRTSLGVRMLESVKVLHALGKKNETKTGLSSCRLLGNSSNPKDPQPPPAIQPWRHTPREGLWQPCVKQLYWWCHFSNSICSLRVPMSRFGLWQPCVKQLYWWCHFSNSICSLRVPMSRFEQSWELDWRCLRGRSAAAAASWELDWHCLRGRSAAAAFAVFVSEEACRSRLLRALADAWAYPPPRQLRSFPVPRAARRGAGLPGPWRTRWSALPRRWTRWCRRRTRLVFHLDKFSEVLCHSIGKLSGLEVATSKPDVLCDTNSRTPQVLQ
ncbi:uncharacterized protein C2orf78-like [Megaptera novaeangliae]